MKITKTIFIILLAIFSIQGAQKHFSLDSLPFGSGIDLDSGKVTSVNPFLRGNPYLHQSGAYDSTARFDIAWTELGLLWCFCDGYNLLGFFPGFSINQPLENVLPFTASDTSNRTKFTPIGNQPDSMRHLHDNSNGLAAFLVKTNRNNWAIITVREIKESIIVCTFPPQNCVTRIKLEWWLQDDGNISFTDLTSIKPAGKKTGNVSLSQTRKYPVVNLKGQIIKDNHTLKTSALDKLKKGIPVMRVESKK